MPTGHIDVKSLYTNIPQDEGTERMLKYYFNTPLPSHIPEHVALYLRQAVLGHKHFKINGEALRQTSDMDLGTNCAPILANIFMARMEEFLS